MYICMYIYIYHTSYHFHIYFDIHYIYIFILKNSKINQIMKSFLKSSIYIL